MDKLFGITDYKNNKIRLYIFDDLQLFNLIKIILIIILNL